MVLGGGSCRRFVALPGGSQSAEPSLATLYTDIKTVGFFTDAYSIFAINMVLPMLGIIYYDGAVPHSYETALSVVTLGGSIIGQIAFGLGADIWGRRKMYGLELIIVCVLFYPMPRLRNLGPLSPQSGALNPLTLSTGHTN